MSQAKEGVDDKRSLSPSKGMKARAKAFFPVLQWLPNYDRKNLRFDIVAGITVGAITVPEAIAYANLAGLPSPP